MNQTTSRDGTPLACDRIGDGPPVILVTGVFNARGTGAPLAAFLAPRFTVFGYDRRGRGDSGDVAPYAVEREVEDLDALIRAAGGSASVFGYSSGAMLVFVAAAAGLPIQKVALYDLPPSQSPQHAVALASLVGEGRRGEAVEYFQRQVVGIPEDVVVRLRQAPFRPALEAMAHTLVYEAILMAERPIPDLVDRVRSPVLLVAAGAGAPVMREVAETVARALPDGRSIVLDDATHDLVPEQIGPVLDRFFGTDG